MYIMSLCTVALIHDVTSETNIEVFSKKPSCVFNLDLSLRLQLLQAPLRSHFMLRSLGFALFSDTKPGQVPGWVMIICCVVGVK